MRQLKIIGLSILFIIWVWLAWILLNSSGVNLKNLLILAMSAIIIFVPLYKRTFGGGKNEQK